jgi:hypothetical protein
VVNVNSYAAVVRDDYAWFVDFHCRSHVVPGLIHQSTAVTVYAMCFVCPVWLVLTINSDCFPKQH